MLIFLKKILKTVGYNRCLIMSANSYSGIKTVKAMAVEPQSQRKWEEQLAGYVKSSFRASNLGNIAGQIAGFINKATTCIDALDWCHFSDWWRLIGRAAHRL